ncbi:MAG TPA: NAD-binding protein, partial [Pyrinomonadaceae bacterium]
NTEFEGSRLRDANFRERAGVNIVGVWESGVLEPAGPDRILTDLSVPVAVGSSGQIEKLEALLSGHETRPLPGAVLVIGGGKVGSSAALSLKKKGVEVFVVDSDPRLKTELETIADRVTIGNAADRETLLRGGLREASLAILSTNDDAVNTYLSIYCRRLNPDIRIVSRITHERNREAIHRAGTDFVLSYANLGAESVLSYILGREPLIIGGKVEMFNVPVPLRLVGKTLAQSGIGAETGLIVLAVFNGYEEHADLSPRMELPEQGQLTLLGTPKQLMKFKRLYR